MAEPRRRRMSRRDEESPNSVILTADSSLFSSPSVDHCSLNQLFSISFDSSSASYHLNHYHLNQLYLNFNGSDTTQDSSSSWPHHRRPSEIAPPKCKNEDKATSITTSHVIDGLLPDTARNSFSLALKECKDRRSRADQIMTKGWSSEWVPPPSSSAKRGGAQPFNPSAARALPSKWEDAERWICSPIAAAHQSGPNGPRKPKSKSGPLGPPGFAMYSPLTGGENPGGPSPFSAGVVGIAGGLSGGVSTGTMTCVGFPTRNEPFIARSVSVHGCSEMVALQSLNSLEFADDKLDGFKDSAVSRRDMATQMSPEGSGHYSPNGRLSFSALASSALQIVYLELQNIGSSKCDVRDVQVDERVTVARWSRRHRGRTRKKSSDIADAPSSGWDMSDAATSISKFNSEEAKINAWENLQKAKAEMAIRKLEMKLEKKRSSSMDKIMNKLRHAQKRAQEMRSVVLANQAHEVSKTSRKAVAFRRTWQMGSLSGCFTCHAF